MKFYCGIDLSARDCHVCVIDQQLKIVVQQKLRNELPKIVQLLEPYKANLKIVVESTFNWYWLIDGLQAAGFEVMLAHTLGLYLITGALAELSPETWQAGFSWPGSYHVAAGASYQFRVR